MENGKYDRDFIFHFPLSTFHLFFEAFGVRCSCNTLFGNDSGHEFVWRYVKCVIRDADAVGGELNITDVSDLPNIPFLYWNLFAGRTIEINRGKRSSNVERNAMLSRKHSDHIRTDLVRHIAVCCNAVRTNHNRLYLSLFHNVAGHIVGDKGDRDVVLMQLPGGEPCTLEIRPCFVSDHRDVLARIDGPANNAQRRSPNTARSQSS